MTALTLNQVCSSNSIHWETAPRNVSIRYARNRCALTAGLRQPGCRRPAGAAAVDPAGIPDPLHHPRPAAPAHVHRLGLVPDHFSGRPPPGQASSFTTRATSSGSWCADCHIHHLVWGILILLLVGYGWLLDLGRSHSPLSIFFSRLMSVSYGVGAALTLDEFALWLNLDPDAYWSHRAPQHRRRHSLRQPAGRGRMGRAVLPRPAAHVGQARLLRKELGRGLTFPIRRVRLLRPRKVRRPPPRIAP